jgi:sulfate/thiosulfate transport system substrate-binding protein
MKSLTRKTPRPSRWAAATVLTAAAALAMAGCSSSAGGAGDSKTVNIVGFSTPKPAYDALATGFNKTSAGKGVQFSSSYGPSGSQAKAVAAGQTADYVALSVGSDMESLAPKFVDSSWDSNSAKGIGADSVVVICVRPGNPKHITGWDDLIKPGVGIVTADPASSGSAKWNILAAYEHVISEGGTQAQAQAYLGKFFKNTVAKADSGSDAAKTFLSGTGDALISYESEAITARQAGEKLDYIVPKESFLIQTPVAVTKTAPPAAKDFLSYVESDAGQKIFASKGWRPVKAGVNPGTVQGANDPSNPYPQVQKLTTIDDLGGWDKVNTEFFDSTNGIVTKIEGGS